MTPLSSPMGEGLSFRVDPSGMVRVSGRDLLGCRNPEHPGFLAD